MTGWAKKCYQLSFRVESELSTNPKTGVHFRLLKKERRKGKWLNEDAFHRHIHENENYHTPKRDIFLS